MVPLQKCLPFADHLTSLLNNPAGPVFLFTVGAYLSDRKGRLTVRLSALSN